MALRASSGDEGMEKDLESGTSERSWLPPRSHVRLYTSGQQYNFDAELASSPIDFRPPQRTDTGNFSMDSLFKQNPNTPLARFAGWFERVVLRMMSPNMFVVGMFVTAIYSTIFSTIWFIIAIVKPHWGTIVAMHGGTFTPTVASTLVAGIAKTIEMSFSTVMIVCLGQYLTNKAKQTGISLVDLQLKSMILLPLSLVTQKGGVRALLRSGLLGLICVTAYTAAALYTTASDAVVSPRIDMSHPTVMNLSAYLQASVANPFAIESNCPNPPSSVKSDQTCITTQHAGISLHNYLQYLSNWQSATSQHKIVTQATKPVPIASYGDSIAVQGQWMYPVDYNALSSTHGRLVTGANMAMPFAGVVNATTIPENRLNIAGQLNGKLSIKAKAVTPMIGVTCAVATPEELAPIVYSEWSHPGGTKLDVQDFSSIYKNWTWRTNTTVLDDLFQFNNKTRHRPVFYSLPEQYSSEFDGEGTYRDMLYILFNSNVSSTSAETKSQYTLCGMNFTLIGGCSSVYTADSSGTSLTLDCDKHKNHMAFPSDKIKLGATPSDWVSTGAVWGRSISLGDGILNSSAASLDLLTQLAPTNASFNPVEPSLADSLAILSAGTLLQSTTDAPFDGNWSYNITNNLLPSPVLQKFQAEVKISDYSSGMKADWKNIFVAVLFLVVCLNIGALAYLIIVVFGRVSVSKRGFRRMPPQTFQEDITELREVFTAAIHSPTVRIINTPRPGNRGGIRWKYQNGVFRPSRLASYASNKELHFQ